MCSHVCLSMLGRAERRLASARADRGIKARLCIRLCFTLAVRVLLVRALCKCSAE